MADNARRVESVRKGAPLGVGAGFVDEDDALKIKLDLPFAPLLTRRIYTPRRCSAACALLSTVIFPRWKKRQRESADRYSTTIQQLTQLRERDIRFRFTASKNQLCMCFDALRRASAGPARSAGPVAARKLAKSQGRHDKPPPIAAITLWKIRIVPSSCMLPLHRHGALNLTRPV